MHVTEKNCNELSDLEVVRKSLQEVDYFMCLYKRYEPKLLRYIKRISFSSPEEAEDILQEAYIKIWRNLHDFDQTMKFSSWIYRVVHNETVSFWRKKKSYGKDQVQELDENLFETQAETLDDEDDQENKALMIQEILQLLPIKYREILVLKFFEMMSYEEISDVLKIPEGTVATRINRAKKAFIEIGGNKFFL
ncbi:MAG: RNA polymerase sigma factor [Saprospiraceae bacterium]|nr:RNA polymerase sigma factor [Saprospiraceae bacterium]MCB9327053.1 RNA polymerase sigma factor [Lewinellaceae bacterium]